MKILVVFTVLAGIASSELAKGNHFRRQKQQQPNSYLCPTNFVRTKHNKCYFFSRTSENFDRAFWECAERRSTLAVIRGRNQDNTLRRLLNKNKIDHVERWIGATYNWEKMKWQWAGSGKPLNYTGFGNQIEEYKKWQCIVLDPRIQYKWNVRNCFEKKHFICQTRIKKSNVQPQQSHKLNKKLNEVPVPEVPDNEIASPWNKFGDEANPEEKNAVREAAFATRRKPSPLRRGKGNRMNRKSGGGGGGGKPRRKKGKVAVDKNRLYEAQQDAPAKESPKPRKIKWVTYHGPTSGPLHPRLIVEDFDFQKNETAG